MGIQGGSSGRCKLALCQKGFELFMSFLPVGIGLVEYLRDAAPADILGKGFLFLSGSSTAFLFKIQKHFNGCNVAVCLGALAAFAQMIVTDAVVTCGRRFLGDICPRSRFLAHITGSEINDDASQLHAIFSLSFDLLMYPCDGFITEDGIAGGKHGFVLQAHASCLEVHAVHGEGMVVHFKLRTDWGKISSLAFVDKLVLALFVLTDDCNIMPGCPQLHHLGRPAFGGIEAGHADGFAIRRRALKQAGIQDLACCFCISAIGFIVVIHLYKHNILWIKLLIVCICRQCSRYFRGIICFKLRNSSNGRFNYRLHNNRWFLNRNSFQHMRCQFLTEGLIIHIGAINVCVLLKGFGHNAVQIAFQFSLGVNGCSFTIIQHPADDFVAIL